VAAFHAKEVFQQAREAERQGRKKEAATHYASLSVYLRRRGKTDEAITLLRRGLGLAPHLAKLHLQLAICTESKGETEQANSAMADFSQIVIERGKVEQYRSVVDATLKQYPRLRERFFDAVLQLDRTGAEAYLGRAQSLKEQGDSQGALKVLLEALQTGAEKDQVLEAMEEMLRTHGKAEALIHLGRYREGKISTDNLLVLLRGSARENEPGELEPVVHETPLKDLIEELEKEIGGTLQNPADEIAPLLKEFRRRSQPILGVDARARMDMALAFFEMGLVREAAEELAVVPESDPLHAEAQALAGEIALSTGNHLAALDAFQNALRSTHRSEEVEREARYKLVQVFYRLGDLRQAFSQAAELERLAPEYRDLRLLKNQIEQALDKQSGGSR
jgi:tetratricopeptide (TPR) repeat protein